MSQFKTTPEVLRAYADLMERHAAAGLLGSPPPYRYNKFSSRPSDYPILTIAANTDPTLYEMPVGIVEGEHVWLGDTLYRDEFGTPTHVVVTQENCRSLVWVTWSLFPKQKPRVSGQNPPYDGTTDSMLVAFLTDSGMLIHCEVNSEDYKSARQRKMRRVPREDKRATVTSEAV